jgi:hypothetical protein
MGLRTAYSIALDNYCLKRYGLSMKVASIPHRIALISRVWYKGLPRNPKLLPDTAESRLMSRTSGALDQTWHSRLLYVPSIAQTSGARTSVSPGLSLP